MFTIEQIQQAHAKVKSGADFPNYVQELKELGLHYYDNYVSDGHTDYYGTDRQFAPGPAKYDTIEVAAQGDKAVLERDIKAHQQGQSDYLTICRQAAEAGVENWRVDLEKMTCTYYDKAGSALLVEDIPMP